MIRLSTLVFAVILAAGPVLADKAAMAAARALVTPMMAEVAPGPAGAILSECIVANADGAELATLATAPGPDQAIGALVSAILARPSTIACIEAAAG